MLPLAVAAVAAVAAAVAVTAAAAVAIAVDEGVMDCMGNAYPLFYCAQSPLDHCLQSNPTLYEQYKATIRELLQVVNPPAYR